MVALADNISLAWECWDTRTQGEGEIDSSLLLLIIADYSRAEKEKFCDQILKYNLGLSCAKLKLSKKL